MRCPECVHFIDFVRGVLTVAVAEPDNLFLVEEIERLTGHKAQIAAATAAEIESSLRAYLPDANVFVIDDIYEDIDDSDFSVIERDVTELADLIKRTLEEGVGAPLQVVGEVSNLSDRKHWYFSLKDDQAVITLAFAHAGERREECRQLSPEELAKLPPNMRIPMDCPRERSPLTVELHLDGELAARVMVPPTGLSRDGAGTLYRRLAVPAGEHTLLARMNDSVRVEGFNYERGTRVQLAPRQVLVVDFNEETGGFVFK